MSEATDIFEYPMPNPKLSSEPGVLSKALEMPAFEVVASIEDCADEATTTPEQRARVRRATQSLKTVLNTFQPVEIGDETS